MTSVAAFVAPVEGGRGRSLGLGLLATAYLGLFIGGMVANSSLAPGAAFPNPYGPGEVVRAYYMGFPPAVRATAAFQFVSAMVLGAWTVAATARLGRGPFGGAAAGLANFGGMAAALSLAVSALANWALSMPGVAGESGARALAVWFAFACGAAGYVVPLGLLVGGVSAAASTDRLLPRWLIVAGLVIAPLALLSAASLLWPPANILLPLGRFPGFLWLIAAGFRLGSRPSDRG